MSLLKEFKAFALKGNVIDLAVAVVVGGAFGKIVSALVADIIMPVLSRLPAFMGNDWRTYEVTSLHLKLGDFLGAVIDFVLIAFVLFLVVVKAMGALKRKEEAPAPTTRACPECLETIPLAARKCKACGSAVVAAVLLALLCVPGLAAAQPDPTFRYTKAEEIEAARKLAAVQWAAQVKAGLVGTTGNSQTSTFTFAGSMSRQQANNRFAFDAGIAYARSAVMVARDGNMNGLIDPGELVREDQTTANAWFAKGRYDRFFSSMDAAFVAGLIGADRPAGKILTGGMQVGYSRYLYRSDRHGVVAELGYDLSHEEYITPIDSSVTIHSARAFVGETTKLSSATSLYANVEGLFNLSSEQVANANELGRTTVDPLHDTRVTGKTGITTTLWASLSFTLGVGVRYDHNPAVRPQLSGAPPYAPGYLPFADKVDTLTEAALIFNFI